MPRWIRQLALFALVLPASTYSSPQRLDSYAVAETASPIVVAQISRASSAANSDPAGEDSIPAVVTTESVLKQTSLLIERIKSSSFPELGKAEIRLQILESHVDFFRTRFGLPQFFLGKKMHYLIRVNPKLFELRAPEGGLEAIIAHELSHVVYYSQGNRVRLFGLTRLLSKTFTARFERWTDLQAISRGYGEGLKAYRQWLYQHVPRNKLEEKRRNYFSPAEIDAILLRIQSRPELLDYWLKNTPRSLKEIEKQ